MKAIQVAEIQIFGRRYSDQSSELKGKRLLNKKVFRLANQLEEIPFEQRNALAKKCLEDASNAGRWNLTALAQAKLAYVKQVFERYRAIREVGGNSNYQIWSFAWISDLNPRDLQM